MAPICFVKMLYSFIPLERYFGVNLEWNRVSQMHFMPFVFHDDLKKEKKQGLYKLFSWSSVVEL